MWAAQASRPAGVPGRAGSGARGSADLLRRRWGRRRRVWPRTCIYPLAPPGGTDGAGGGGHPSLMRAQTAADRAARRLRRPVPPLRPRPSPSPASGSTSTLCSTPMLRSDVGTASTPAVASLARASSHGRAACGRNTWLACASHTAHARGLIVGFPARDQQAAEQTWSKPPLPEHSGRSALSSTRSAS